MNNGLYAIRSRQSKRRPSVSKGGKIVKRLPVWFRLILYLAGSLLLAGCVVTPEGFGFPRAIRGSGEVVTRELELIDFERVEVHNAFQANIRQGDDFRVVVEVDEAALPFLRTTKQGNALQIGLEPGVSFIGNVTLRAEVTMPTLSGLSASGASVVEFAGFSSSQNLDLNASGASSLRGEIDAGNTRMDVSGAGQVTLNGELQDISLEVSGASRITLSGEGKNTRIHASGGCQVDLSEFPVEDAAIEASGASIVTVQANGTLDVEASGGSKVYYLGNPTLGQMQTSGGSTVGRQ
jgi:hypothetical protein